MFAAVARYLANVAGPAGTLLLLDDVQWAGADALDLLANLLHTPGKHPQRVVGAYRSTEVRPPDPLSALLADLGAAGLAQEARLGPLDPKESSALLEGILAEQAHVDATLREQLLRRTGGIPYFLVSCAEALREDALAGRASWTKRCTDTRPSTPTVRRMYAPGATDAVGTLTVRPFTVRAVTRSPSMP